MDAKLSQPVKTSLVKWYMLGRLVMSNVRYLFDPLFSGFSCCVGCYQLLNNYSI